MARPCYVYLKLNMPGPKGVITITGNRKKAEECFQKGSKIADAQMAVVELQEYQDKYIFIGHPKQLGIPPISDPEAKVLETGPFSRKGFS